MRKARFLVVDLPQFSLERLGYHPSEPVVVVEERHQCLRVSCVSNVLEEHGIALGMRATEARALCGELLVIARDPIEEQADLYDLCQCARQLCEAVKVRDARYLEFEISRILHLYPDETALRERFVGFFEAMGHQVHLRTADHPRIAVACLLAQTSHLSVPPGQTFETIAELPLAVLQPSGEMLADTRALGLQTIREWVALDPADIGERFGSEGLRLRAIALGQVGRGWTESVQNHDIRPISIEFEEGCHTVERLLLYAQKGLMQLQEQLHEAELMVRELRVQLRASATIELRLQWIRGLRAADEMVKSLRRALEGKVFESPIEGLTIYPGETGRWEDRQDELLSRRENSGRTEELVALLARDLQGQVLHGLHFRNTWVPEEVRVPRVQAQFPSEVADPVWRQEQWRHGARRRLPVRLKALARPVEVGETHGYPSTLRGKRHHHQLEPTGPSEHLRVYWWRPEGAIERVYWEVESTRGRCWLYHALGQWYLQGWFD